MGELPVLKTEKLVVLFADVTRSTQMYESLGDTLALQRIGECFSVLVKITEENNGRVIKTIGDEMMVTFLSADAAVLAAASIQETVTRKFTQDNPKIRLRIGLHCGKVVVVEGDVFGSTVNIAARLVKLANPGQILTTGATISAVSTDLGSRTRLIGRFPITGNGEMTRVYEVLLSEAQRDPELTVPSEDNLILELPYLLRLRHREKEIRFYEEGRTVLMGRDSGHELVIDEALVSRNHASIEYSHGKFMLEDHSTNGTFVLTNEGETIHVHREKFLLQGTGQISLGREPTDNLTELVQFSLHKV